MDDLLAAVDEEGAAKKLFSDVKGCAGAEGELLWLDGVGPLSRGWAPSRRCSPTPWGFSELQRHRLLLPRNACSWGR